jgi:hypothetical protein
MVALFFIPVVVLVVVVSIAERKRNKCGEYSDREKKRKRHPKTTKKAHKN